MSDKVQSNDSAPVEASRRQKHSVDQPVLRFDLEEEAARLWSEARASDQTHNAKTLSKHADMRIVLMVLSAGHRLQTHKTDHGITVQALSGRVRMHLPDETVELGSGRLLALGRSVPHDVEAIEDSVVLLSVGWSGPSGG